MDNRPLVSVVDDNESVRESLPDLLTSLGFRSRAFSSAADFLASDALDLSACLILDVAMPGMSGPALQRELLRRRHALPVVFITAHEDHALKQRVLDQGAVAWLLKPFSDTALHDAVNTALRTPVVVVIDDDVSVREGLEMLVRCAGWRPETYESAHAFLARPIDDTPGCLVLDVELPGLNGLDLQKRLADRPERPIIFITGHGDIPITVQAMKAGAMEFLIKPFGDEQILNAIRHALERSRAAVERAHDIRQLQARYDSLTRRERDVMTLVVAGLLNKQIGAQLGTSEATIKSQRGKVMQKMEAGSLADLVRMAGRLNLPTFV